MRDGKRATFYFDPHLHRALRLEAPDTERSVSEPVHDAVRYSLAEDPDDRAAFEVREREPELDFEGVLEDLKRRGQRNAQAVLQPQPRVALRRRASAR